MLKVTLELRARAPLGTATGHSQPDAARAPLTARPVTRAPTWWERPTSLQGPHYQLLSLTQLTVTITSLAKLVARASEYSVLVLNEGSGAVL